MKYSRANRRLLTGFTLIELLIVIAIIGILSGILFVSIGQGPLKRARDAKRKSDLNQIRFALELFFQDKGYYPHASTSSGTCNATNGGWDCNGYNYSTNSSWDTFAADLAPYIASLPKDPINNVAGPWTPGNFSYTYGNVGKTLYPAQYDLTTQLEDTTDNDRCGVKHYKWYFVSYDWCDPANLVDTNPYSRQIYEASPR